MAWASSGGGRGGQIPPLLKVGGHSIICPPHFLVLYTMKEYYSRMKKGGETGNKTYMRKKKNEEKEK